MNKIKKMNCEQLYQFHRDITDEFLFKLQKEYDNNLYPDKSPNDKLKCQICGGKYTRSSKSKHDCSDRHKKIIREIHKDIKKAMYRQNQIDV